MAMSPGSSHEPLTQAKPLLCTKGRPSRPAPHYRRRLQPGPQDMHETPHSKQDTCGATHGQSYAYTSQCLQQGSTPPLKSPEHMMPHGHTGKAIPIHCKAITYGLPNHRQSQHKETQQSSRISAYAKHTGGHTDSTALHGAGHCPTRGKQPCATAHAMLGVWQSRLQASNAQRHSCCETTWQISARSTFAIPSRALFATCAVGRTA